MVYCICNDYWSAILNKSWKWENPMFVLFFTYFVTHNHDRKREESNPFSISEPLGVYSKYRQSKVRVFHPLEFWNVQWTHHRIASFSNFRCFATIKHLGNRWVWMLIRWRWYMTKAAVIGKLPKTWFCTLVFPLFWYMKVSISQMNFSSFFGFCIGKTSYISPRAWMECSRATKKLHFRFVNTLVIPF